jgi:hypothetical protein
MPLMSILAQSTACIFLGLGFVNIKTVGISMKTEWKGKTKLK